MFLNAASLFVLIASAASVLAVPMEALKMRAVSPSDQFHPLNQARATTPAVEKRAVVASDYLNPHNAARAARGAK